jgi:hypothetical protein
MTINAVLKLITNLDFIISGNDLYLSKESLKKFVNVCQEHKRSILGIELFELNGDHLIPLIDKLADFSEAGFEKSIELTRQFIKHEMSEKMVANITL